MATIVTVVEVTDNDRVQALAEGIKEVFAEDIFLPLLGVDSIRFQVEADYLDFLDEHEGDLWDFLLDVAREIQGKVLWVKWGDRIICRDENGVPDGDYIDKYKVSIDSELLLKTMRTKAIDHAIED